MPKKHQNVKGESQRSNSDDGKSTGVIGETKEPNVTTYKSKCCLFGNLWRKEKSYKLTTSTTSKTFLPTITTTDKNGTYIPSTGNFTKF